MPLHSLVQAPIVCGIVRMQLPAMNVRRIGRRQWLGPQRPARTPRDQQRGPVTARRHSRNGTERVRGRPARRPQQVNAGFLRQYGECGSAWARHSPGCRRSLLDEHGNPCALSRHRKAATVPWRRGRWRAVTRVVVRACAACRRPPPFGTADLIEALVGKPSASRPHPEARPRPAYVHAPPARMRITGPPATRSGTPTPPRTSCTGNLRLLLGPAGRV